MSRWEDEGAGVEGDGRTWEWDGRRRDIKNVGGYFRVQVCTRKLVFPCGYFKEPHAKMELDFCRRDHLQVCLQSKMKIIPVLVYIRVKYRFETKETEL